MLLWTIPLFTLFGWSYCVLAPLEIVDMTYTFNNDTLYSPHLNGFKLVVTEKGTKRGFWLQLEEYSSATHVGTHLDAPCHIKRENWCVDAIPINRLIAPAAVIDITSKARENRDYLLTAEDLQNWETNTRHSLDGMIVLVYSGWGQRWDDREAFTGTASNDTNQLHYPSISPEAAQWLVKNRRVIGVGTDTLSLDGAQNKEFDVHRTLLSTNIYGLEMVSNVDKLPPIGATMHVFPMKIAGSSGAPVRIIGSFPKRQ